MRWNAASLTLLLSLLGLPLAVTGQEQDKEKVSWFQVEVVVFEYTQPDTDGESWYNNPGLPGQTDSIDLVQGDTPAWLQQPGDRPVENRSVEEGQGPVLPDRIPFLALPEEAYNLDGVYRILQLASAYRPLLHTSWQQPGREEAQARYVHIEGLRPAAEELAPAADTEATGVVPEENPDYSTPEMAFDAILRLRSSLYLHLDVDAAYFPADPAVLRSGISEEEAPAYLFADYVRLQETRRIRLKELHYFDHPLFGVLVQVTRIEEDKSEQ
jgi:hypothetical protein